MSLIRHCDMCNVALEKYGVYIQVSLEHDSDASGLVVGLPFQIEGDYCSMTCLSARVMQMME